jgi:2-polyprenyl-3-methyl-5-hydroxy-6-metoxy-1,4-benzoquinol methylase
MSTIAKFVMGKFYRQAAGDPKRLRWHRETPSQILISAVAACKERGRALDVGCGAGVFSVWLAEQGMDVTGIGPFPEAITMARALGDKKNATVFDHGSVHIRARTALRPRLRFRLLAFPGGRRRS